MTKENIPSIYELYGTSIEDSETGKWFDFGPGIRVKIRRFNSQVATDVRRKLEEPYAHYAQRGETIPTEITDAIMVDQVSEGIVVAWEGVTDIKGKVLECTPTNVKKLISDKRLADFYNKIVITTTNADQYRIEQEKASVKN